MSSKTKVISSDYVHLHNHTEYSVLDGLTKIKPLMEKVLSEGMTAVAITDHGTLSGAIDFYKEAKSRNIKPIIGIETYVASRSHLDKDPAKDKQRFHLILLAMNSTGYKNLMRISTIANVDGFYYYPRIDHDLLEKYNEGIICLSGCLGGELGDALVQGQQQKAEEVATWYKKVFGDRYYLEVQDHGHPKNSKTNETQNRVNESIIAIGKKLDIPIVVTCDAHYLNHEDQEAHEILLCVGTGSYYDEEQRMTLVDYPLHVESPKEIIERWGETYPEAILNTKAIADRCDLNIELGKILIPKFPVPKGKTEKSVLKEQVYQGLAWRYGGVDREKSKTLTVEEAKKKLKPEIIERSDYELEVIFQMGFSGYFLIISDFINWGKEQDIVFGPGRGSAAGSIISYALRITELDPMLYDLLFERFLNPERISMPDIDIDIQDTRREEVINYCVEKYGRDHVANIVTFGRMFARNAVRDVSRVLRVPYTDADRLAKMIPPPVQGRHIPLTTSLKENQELKEEYDSSLETKKILDLATILEGTVRSHGVHAAGVVIAPDDIVNYVPLEVAQKGVMATQYSMGPIEELGLLKMDFLGLSNLTIIKNALRIIKKVYGKNIDIGKIPLDDQKTLQLFQQGDTTGVFQFESSGMKRYLKELKPTVFEDLIAMNALYRPGPMQWIDDFIARKNQSKRIEYIHPSMEPALKNTYGVIVYQEQVMQISIDTCGFTGGQADTLRKAIGKKKPEELAKMKTAFIEGAIKKSNAKRDVMESFWTQLEDFAAYCFNKSHASCYALIAYQTAYLKAHYPSAFMSALMTSNFDDIEKLAIEINECKHMGIDVLNPDVNESFLEFGIVPGTSQIRFGMGAIKNVGSGAAEEIIRAREEGKFTSVEDFFKRVNIRIVNRKALESLIKSGAFDNLGERNSLLFNLDTLLAFSSRLLKDQLIGQTDLFGGTDSTPKSSHLNLAPTQPAEQNLKLKWERELMGLYLSEHPLDVFETILSEKAVPISELSSEYNNKKVIVGGLVTEIRAIQTKSGQKMAFAKIEDFSGELELVIFPKIYAEVAEIIQRDVVVVAKGKLQTTDQNGRESDPKVIVDEITELTYDQAKKYKSTGKQKKLPKKSERPINYVKEEPAIKRLYIRLSDSDDHSLLRSLKEALDSYKGNTDVVLVMGNENSKQIIKLPTKISADDNSLRVLCNLVGAENVRLH